MSKLHSDVLFVVLQDLTGRRDSGEISDVEYVNQALPIYCELYQRIDEKTLKNEQRLEGLEREYQGLQQLQKENQQTYMTDLARYEEFLQLKGLSEEFEEWEFQKSEAERDG